MPSTPTTKSGIIATPTGDRHIPASVRPDGTLRKEIRVRPGYRPPEDVEVYKNRTAEHFKARGVPGAEYTDAPKPKPAAKPSKLKAEKKEKEEVKADKQEEDVKEVVPIDLEAEKEKEAKKLTKKYRQAKELAQKKEDGGALLPEQFQKVIRMSELIRQLEKLGYDLEGNKKT